MPKIPQDANLLKPGTSLAYTVLSIQIDGRFMGIVIS